MPPYPCPLIPYPSIARAAESWLWSVWSTETMHDPFLPGALIAEHTQRLRFARRWRCLRRSPATIAYTAGTWRRLRGALHLGWHTGEGAIERRFGMPWPESVVGKLREQIAAMRAFCIPAERGAVELPRDTISSL